MSTKNIYVWIEKRKRKKKHDKFYIRIELENGKRITHHTSYDNEDDAKKAAKNLELELSSEQRRNEMMSTETLTKDIKDKIIEWQGKEGNLIMIFHEIQNHYGYIPRNVALEVSTLLKVPLAKIYEVLTFYHYFKLEPRGKYVISVCMGTACYLKGAPDIIEAVELFLNIKEGETTKDGLFQLESVRCIGCCGVAPAITINNEVKANVNKDNIINMITEILKKEKQNK